jgi:Mn2+/Fe2+ NRAMP family transporter
MSQSPSHEVKMIEEPPTTVLGILRRLGPGLIVAGSIVGSGELIATTKTGAEAGFWLLWLIIIGCVIKVFTQVEFGRFSINDGQTTMSGMNEVPGPAVEVSLTGRPGGISFRGNWLVWYWFVMFLASIGQLGGIVGGVGQALAISLPLTNQGREFNAFVDVRTELQVKQGELRRTLDLGGPASESGEQTSQLRRRIAELNERLDAATVTLVGNLGLQEFKKLGGDPRAPDFMEVARRRVAQLAPEAANDAEQWDALARGELQALGCDPQAPQLEQLVTGLGKQRFQQLGERPPGPPDARYWATLVAVITSVLLVMGRYGLIQFFATTMVAAFTLVTVVNLAMLQANPTWRVNWSEIVNGLRFQLPPLTGGGSGLTTALATFGIIGVGASELVTYPYWCLEKGYARFSGPREGGDQWAARARGWMRVLRWDAWCSMFVYTFATLAFYLLGAAILGRTGLNPEKDDMVRTLAVMYEPVFGPYAPGLFLFGAFAVLYSTYFVANASHARVFSDALRVLGFVGQSSNRRLVTLFSGLFPLLCLAIYVAFPAPAQLVLLSGLMQAIMLPMLAGAALYFRYCRSDKRLRPGRLWDVFLWISAAGMLISGGWALIDKIIGTFF